MNPQIKNLQLVIAELENKNYYLEMTAHLLLLLFLGALLVMLLVVLRYRLLKDEIDRLKLQVKAAEEINQFLSERYITQSGKPQPRRTN